MIFLDKPEHGTFVLLNLTDPQLNDEEWKDGHPNGKLLRDTVQELMNRVHPDLVTVSGDIAWAGCHDSYDCFADMMDSFRVPWAPVWGNHDNQGGPEEVEYVVTRYLNHPFCLYEHGDPKLGNGNYTVAVRDGDRVCEGIILMDSHNRISYLDEEGQEKSAWACVSPEQLDWYEEQVKALARLGCSDSTLIMHIPIYAYREACQAAYRPGMDRKAMTYEQSLTPDCWNEGYENAYGVMHEGIGSWIWDEGALDRILKLNHTKLLICGHDHIDNFVIPFKGVKFVYGLKTGAGCYWEKELNGGTVVEIGAEGVKSLRHEFVSAE